MAVGDQDATARRRGRRPGTSTTRQAILTVARAHFAGRGFAATTIRGIALDAGVDAALVMRFFGSKHELFAAVMSLSPQVLTRFGTVFEGPDEQLGERVVRAFLDAWEGAPADAEPLMAMLRGAVVDEFAREQLREFIQARLLAGAGDRDDAALRAGVVSALLVGLVLGRRVLAVPALADAEREDLVRLVAPAVQCVLAPGPDARPTSSS